MFFICERLAITDFYAKYLFMGLSVLLELFCLNLRPLTYNLKSDQLTSFKVSLYIYLII